MPRSAWLLLSLILTTPGHAQDPLPYPEPGPLTADQIVAQVYSAAHGGLVRNAVSRRHGNAAALVVNRAATELRRPGRKPSVQTFDTYVNNAPRDPALNALQMAILTSGKTRGTGVLFTSYSDPSRSAIITLWLPALRKIRTINEPAHEDTWFGTNLTYGELVLRRPEHEVHELLGEATLEGCLQSMRLERWEQTLYTHELPEPQCAHRGKPVYRVKSTARFPNWWYDYHVSDVDKTRFAVYRTVYYKDGERIKTVDIDWQSLDQPDPRITYPRYIYAVTLADGRDSLVYVPRETIGLNQDMPDSFWSEATLKRYRP